MAQMIPSRSGVCAPGLLAAFLAAAPVAAQDHAVPSDRIFEALALTPGATACEMGAGTGELTLAAADQVGAGGRVYSSEMGDRTAALRSRVGRRTNVTVVEAAAERTNFPAAACDAVFMQRVYHHFDAPAAMNASIRAALKPGGRVAVIDFGPPPGAEAADPAGRDQDGHHGVTAPTVARELRAAGFDVVATETGTGRAFMVVAVKRAS